MVEKLVGWLRVRLVGQTLSTPGSAQDKKTVFDGVRPEAMAAEIHDETRESLQHARRRLQDPRL